LQTRGVNFGVTPIVHLHNTNKGVNNWFTPFTPIDLRVYKRQHNACSNYAPLERTALRTRSVTKTNKQTNTTFSQLQPARVVRSSQALHGDRARRAHQKKCHPFFDPTYSFSYRVHGIIWPNLPTRGFSAITP